MALLVRYWAENGVDEAIMLIPDSDPGDIQHLSFAGEALLGSVAAGAVVLIRYDVLLTNTFAEALIDSMDYDRPYIG